MKRQSLPCYCATLRQAARSATSLYEGALAESELHVTQYRALQVLEATPNLTTTELADAIGIDQTTATRTLGHIHHLSIVLMPGTANGLAGPIDKFPTAAADGHSTAYLDAQEQARQMILGTVHYSSVAGAAVDSTPAVSARTDHRTYSDPQELARDLILGRGASEIVSSGRSAQDRLGVVSGSNRAQKMTSIILQHTNAKAYP